VGADQVATIRPIVAELEKDEKEHPSGAKARYFGRFAVPSGQQPWVELYLERETVVNMSFPFEAEPLAWLRDSGVEPLPDARVSDVTRGLFCTFTFARVPSMTLARFVDALFMKALCCGEDYPLDVEVQPFPA
jgi:hypothetical protein